MKRDLLDLLDEVKDRQTFITFVKALIKDRIDETEKEKKNPSSPYGPGANGWENGSIETYLGAAVAWSEGHYRKSGKEEPESWKSFAEFLHAGKTYE